MHTSMCVQVLWSFSVPAVLITATVVIEEREVCGTRVCVFRD